MRIYTGKICHFSNPIWRRIAAFRYRVFVKKLGWTLPLMASAGHEIDEFDRPETYYIIGMAHDGSILGCARLFPTHRNGMLDRVFPHLLTRQQIPAADGVWELSRFAVTRPEVTKPLLAASFTCAREHGAHTLVTVSPLGVERLFRRMKVPAYRLGVPVLADQKWISAFALPLTYPSCSIPSQALRFPSALPSSASSSSMRDFKQAEEVL